MQTDNTARIAPPRLAERDAMLVFGNFDCICGVEVSEFPSQPREFSHLRISPQRYAVFAHSGHISTIGATCSAIWNEALPKSGYQAADGPWFERYGEDFNGRTGFGGVEICNPNRTLISIPDLKRPRRLFLSRTKKSGLR